MSVVTPAENCNSVANSPAVLAEKVARALWLQDFTMRADLMERFNRGSTDPTDSAYYLALAWMLMTAEDERPNDVVFDRLYREAVLKMSKVDLGDEWSSDRTLIAQVVAGVLHRPRADTLLEGLIQAVDEATDYDDLLPHEQGFIGAVHAVLVWLERCIRSYDQLITPDLTPQRQILAEIQRYVMRRGDDMSYQAIVRLMAGHYSYRRGFVEKCLGLLADKHLIGIIMGQGEHTAQYPDRVRLAPYCHLATAAIKQAA